MSWVYDNEGNKVELDEKGHCPHEHTYEDRILLGIIAGFEVYKCPDCGNIYIGLGIPLKYFLLQDRMSKPE